VWAVPGRFFQSLPVPCGAGILYIKATVVSVYLSVVTNRAGQGQGKANTRPLDLLAACSNRLGGLLTVQTSNLHPNKNKIKIKLESF